MIPTLIQLRIITKATPNGRLVSGPVDFQIGMQVGGIRHHIIMPLSDEMLKHLLFFRLSYL